VITEIKGQLEARNSSCCCPAPQWGVKSRTDHVQLKEMKYDSVSYNEARVLRVPASSRALGLLAAIARLITQPNNTTPACHPTNRPTPGRGHTHPCMVAWQPTWELAGECGSELGLRARNSALGFTSQAASRPDRPLVRSASV
jgi:hypothetical protein